MVLEGLAPARRRLVLLVVGALLLALVAVVAVVVVRSTGGAGPVDQAEEGPVVLVPGYGGRVSSLDPLVAELRREGRSVAVLRPADGARGTCAPRPASCATSSTAPARRRGRRRSTWWGTPPGESWHGSTCATRAAPTSCVGC